MKSSTTFPTFSLRLYLWITGIFAVSGTLGLLFTSNIFAIPALLGVGLIGAFVGSLLVKPYFRRLTEAKTMPEKTKLIGSSWIRLLVGPYLLLLWGVILLGMLGAFLTRSGVFVYVIGYGPVAAMVGVAWIEFLTLWKMRHSF